MIRLEDTRKRNAPASNRKTEGQQIGNGTAMHVQSLGRKRMHGRMEA
jgi:hypothetical protein